MSSTHLIQGSSSVMLQSWEAPTSGLDRLLHWRSLIYNNNIIYLELYGPALYNKSRDNHHSCQCYLLQLPAITNNDNYGHSYLCRSISSPASVALAVLHECTHSMLCGQGANTFARDHGFAETDISTDGSRSAYKVWGGYCNHSNSKPTFIWAAYGILLSSLQNIEI